MINIYRFQNVQIKTIKIKITSPRNIFESALQLRTVENGSSNHWGWGNQNMAD